MTAMHSRWVVCWDQYSSQNKQARGSVFVMLGWMHQWGWLTDYECLLLWKAESGSSVCVDQERAFDKSEPHPFTPFKKSIVLLLPAVKPQKSHLL